MNENRIHTFITAAHLGSFSKAAVQLYISPAAVVKQINLLEEETGLKLFIRTNHGILLTDEGTSFLKDMEKLEQDYHAAVKKALSIHQNDLEITLGISALAPGTSLTARFDSIHKADPQLHFNLTDYRNDMNQAGHMLSHLGETVDIVVAFYDNHLLETTGCQAFQLEEMPVSLAVPLSHPLSRYSFITYNMLEDQHILVPLKGIFSDMDKTTADLKKHVKNIHLETFDAYEVSIFNRCVNENIPLLAVDDWKNVHPLVRILPLEGKHAIPFGILYSKKPSEAVIRMLDAMK